MSDALQILEGDCLTTLPSIPDASVQMGATSPPYYGLRDYGHAGQIGLEETPQSYIDKLVRVFREVRRVLKEDGTLWLNLGDSYTSGGRKTRAPDAKDSKGGRENDSRPAQPAGLKPKDLIGIPWRVAFALQADGWYLRSAIPWLKRNCMPESVTDRPTTAVEYVFLLAKNADYYYDHDAVKMPVAPTSVAPTSVARLSQDIEGQMGTERANGGAKTNGNFKAVCSTKNEASGLRRYEGFNARWDAKEKTSGRGGKNSFRGQGHFRDGPAGPANRDGRDGRDMKDVGASMARNRRNSDWFWESWQGLMHDEDGDPLAFVVNPQPYRDAHFATWPPKLVLPMILAGSRAGDVVLDPFFGSGTTGEVALANGRHAIGCELNPDYIALARQRCTTTMGLPLT